MVRLAQLSVRWMLSLAMVMPTTLLAQAQAPAAQPGKAATATVPKAATTGKATAQRHSGKKSKKTPEPEVAQTPPPPPTPEQMAPVAPQVSYQAGQLSITSKNATLAQVLRSVQSKTGATFEIPASANNERVVAQLGPGRATDVLAALLNGSKFDYIILGVQNQPGAVQKLILTQRQSGGATTNTAQNRPAQPTPPQEEPQPEDDYAQPEPPAEEPAAAENPNQPPPGMFRPGAIINGQPNQNGEFPSQNPPDQQAPQQQQGVKTPEQLLQELQRVQQQQQMYQQQLNPANQNLQPMQPPVQQEPQ